ncbi:MAG: HAD family phosphatase [Caulobacteraceae bacterium]
MTLPRRAEAVIFDMDGLLVDTEVLARDAMMAAAHDLGCDLPLPVFLSMVGRNQASSDEILREHFRDEVVLARFKVDWLERFHAVDAAEIRLKAGVVELLDHLDALGLPRAVCTSSPHASVQRQLGPSGIAGRFDAVIARGDYQEGKPHPEPYLKAAAALGADPVACLALEDSHNGVRAAHAAGMMTIMVPDLLDPTEEIRGLCVRIAATLHEVPALLGEGAAR